MAVESRRRRPKLRDKRRINLARNLGAKSAASRTSSRSIPRKPDTDRASIGIAGHTQDAQPDSGEAPAGDGAPGYATVSRTVLGGRGLTDPSKEAQGRGGRRDAGESKPAARRGGGRQSQRRRRQRTARCKAQRGNAGIRTNAKPSGGVTNHVVATGVRSAFQLANIQDLRDVAKWPGVQAKHRKCPLRRREHFKNHAVLLLIGVAQRL